MEFELEPESSSILCTATVELKGQTGVEMEALTAVQVGLLTIYDMCKAVDKGMVMGGVRVLEKRGEVGELGCISPGFSMQHLIGVDGFPIPYLIHWY